MPDGWYSGEWRDGKRRHGGRGPHKWRDDKRDGGWGACHHPPEDEAEGDGEGEGPWKDDRWGGDRGTHHPHHGDKDDQDPLEGGGEWSPGDRNKGPWWGAHSDDSTDAKTSHTSVSDDSSKGGGTGIDYDLYAGKSREGGLASGAALSQEGGMYSGEWVGDVFDGRGVRIWGDGTRYEGDWERGKEHGKGEKQWPQDGSSFSGSWEMGVPKEGTRTWPNGDQFEGTFTQCSQGGLECDGEGTVFLASMASMGQWRGTLNNNTVLVQRPGSGAAITQHRMGSPVLQFEHHQHIESFLVLILSLFLICVGSVVCCLRQHSLKKAHTKEKREMEARFQKDLEDAIERTNKQACFGKTSSVECEKTQHDNAMKQIMDEKDAVNENLVRDLELAQQKLESQTNCINHILHHIQQGSWVKSLLPACCSLLPTEQQQTSWNMCVMKEVSVTLETHNTTFTDVFCTLCPFDKIVKMEIEKRFGVDENHQVVSASVAGNEEVPLTGTSLTLSHFLPSLLVQVKVKTAPVMNIKETDLGISTSLGVGSYGTVFRGTHIPTSRDVAVKSLHDVIMSHYNIDRFKVESEIVSGLRHPNIVQCLGTCTTTSGKLLIVSELMCCSLRQLLSKKRLNFQEVVAIALCVSKGMDGLHRQKYMHRDLSSNNILLDSNGMPKICDFGVSRGMNSQSERAASATVGPGAPVYMSPQMFTGHYTSKGDVWSFGILTTEMIHGDILNSAFPTLPLAQQITFLEQQKGSLPPPDVEEVNRLCREATESSVVECLGRRDACLRTVNTLIHSPDSSLFTPSCGPTGNIGTAADLLFLVVQSCLSICERNRAPFTVIGQILHCCCTSASIALSSSAPSEETLASVITRDQVDHTITQWLSSLAPAITSSTPPSASSPSQPPPSPTGLL